MGCLFSRLCCWSVEQDQLGQKYVRDPARDKKDNGAPFDLDEGWISTTQGTPTELPNDPSLTAIGNRPSSRNRADQFGAVKSIGENPTFSVPNCGPLGRHQSDTQGFQQDVEDKDVHGLIEDLWNKVHKLVGTAFQLETEEIRSSIRKRVFELVIGSGKIAEREEYNRRRQARHLTSELEGDASISWPRRVDSDLASICGVEQKMRKAMRNDAGYWTFEWVKDDEDLEVPRYKRDQQAVFDGPNRG